MVPYPNARSPISRDTVNPMPASIETPSTSRHAQLVVEAALGELGQQTGGDEDTEGFADDQPGDDAQRHRMARGPSPRPGQSADGDPGREEGEHRYRESRGDRPQPVLEPLRRLRGRREHRAP